MATTAKKQKPAATGDSTQSAAPGVTLTMIRLSDLFPSPTNPRKTFPESALKELSDSIRTNGVINPITVRLTSAGLESPVPARTGSSTPSPCGSHRQAWKALCLQEWEAYNASKSQPAKYADLHYYEMNDKKDVVKVLGYEPEVIGRYSYEVVEQGEVGAFEVLFVGAEVWYEEERDKNYTRGWIRLNGKSTSTGSNQDWEMRRIDEMDISETEKQVLRDELLEKRRQIAEANARYRQEQDWRRAIVESAHIKFTSGTTSPEALIQLLRLHIRASVSGHGMQRTWLDMFGKWAADWKPESFAIKVNGEGEGGKTNPKWTKGCEKEWKNVLARHQRKGEYGTMDERAWSDWISESDRSEFVDAIIISLTPFEVVAMFADLSLRFIADRVAGYNRELYDINLFRYVCEATNIDMAALKPELNITDDDKEGFEEDDDFDNDFELEEEGEYDE